MNSKIDVLAVMDAEIIRAGGEAYIAGRDLIQARAAVAELIEATASYSAARGMRPVHVVNAKLSRVRAALARVTGA